MPYITDEERSALKPIIERIFGMCEGKRGRINYCCTLLIHLWTLQQMEWVDTLTKKYKIVNDAYGIACCVAAEFYDAVIVPYEKLKRKLNGPVSQLDTSADGKVEDLYLCECGKTFKESEFVERSDYYLCPFCSSEECKLINNEAKLI